MNTTPLALLRHLPPADADAPDGELLRRYAEERDEAAFAELVRRSGPLVLRACRNALRDPATADDAFQIVFLLLARNAAKLTRSPSVAGWLHTVAVRSAAKIRRAEVRRHRRERSDLKLSAAAQPLEEITWTEVRERIDTELAQLADEYRLPLLLCYIQGLSYAEAARRIGCTLGVLRGRLERGREALRRRLGRCGLPAVLVVAGADVPVVGAGLRDATLVAIRSAGSHSATTVGAWALWAVATAFVAAVAAGVGLAALRGPADPPKAEARPAPAAPLAPPPERVDRYGDPLPPGVLMRFGTLRNRAPITGFGIEKDGTVVTVGPGADVRRWHRLEDKSDEPIPLPLSGLGTSNNYPQVSADGKLVAVCTNEKVFVWETPADAKDKPKEVAVFEIGRPRLYRFSADGTKLAVTTEGNQFCTVHVCDIKTGKVEHMEGGARYIEGVNFSGNGKRLAVVAQYDVILWEVATGKQLAKNETDGRIVSEFALNHAGDLLVAPVSYARKKDEWRFMDPLTGKKKEGLTGPEGRLWVTFAPDDKTLLVGHYDRIEWWDPVAGKLIRRFDGVATESHALQRSVARFSPDGKMLVAHNGCAILRWDATTGKPLFAEQDVGHGAYPMAVGVSPDGKLIATCGMDSRVCVWEATTGKEVAHARAAWTGPSHIDFSPDGKFLYVSGPEWAELTKYETTTGKVARKFTTDPKEPKQGSMSDIRLAKDGKTVFGLSSPVVTNDPGFVTLWDTATGERLKTTRMPTRATIGAELSPNAVYVATSAIGRSAVVEVAAPEKDLLKAAKIPGFSFTPGHFSDDGSWLTKVYAETEGGLKYSAVVISTLNWGVACTIPMAKHGAAALSEDGRVLAIAVEDQLEFFDVATTKSLGNYRVPLGGWEKAQSGFTYMLRFTPDGTKLITGHADTTALVWPVPRPAK